MPPGQRVLLVEPDSRVRLTIDVQLSALGWDAVVLNTGAEAIRAMEMGCVADMLLTEVVLPDLDGVTVAWTVGRISHATRVAFMGAVWPDRPLEPEGAPFVLKPFSTTVLAQALASAVRIRRQPR